jgi:hypothetical protein
MDHQLRSSGFTIAPAERWIEPDGGPVKRGHCIKRYRSAVWYRVAASVVVAVCLIGVLPGCQPSGTQQRAVTTLTEDVAQTSLTASAAPVADTNDFEEPWDYSPYRVQLWLASEDNRAGASLIAAPLHEFFDRQFAAIWQLSIHDAPIAVRTAAARSLASINYDSITSVDPVIAVKRNHSEAARIRFSADVGTYVKRCLSTPDRIANVLARGKAVGNESLNGAAKVLEAIDGDALALGELWKDPATEAILINRGMASKLKDPEAKIISLPIDQLVAETIERNDKLFIVHIESTRLPWTVSVVELDCLMRNFSTVHRKPVFAPEQLASVIGETVTEVFAPLVRIEEAGTKTADGLVRAAGLIVEENSPALVREGEFLVPMVRKNDRNGDPISIGPLSWAYLHVKSVDDAKLQMDYHAGKLEGLQGRRNKRTFRTATRVRPLGEHTVVRLHAQRDPNTPLVGYEVYEKALDSPEMTFVDRTDWDGRIEIDKSDNTMRLLYVKNGGAVLARLPVVPGQSQTEVADLFGDDQRLRAEAYIRGTQNAIVDLVGIRQLLADRIRKRLDNGQVKEAKELLEALRQEPTYEKIAGDMGRRLIQLKGRNAVEQMKIDKMFAETREMLVKNISPALLREVEELVLAAEKRPQPAPAADAAVETESTEQESAAQE